MQETRSACDSCRRRKVRCDSLQPCSRCVRSGVECTYGSTRRRGLATSYVASLEQQIAELQRQLQAAENAPSGATSASSAGTEDVDLLFPLHQPLNAQQQPIDLLVHAGDDLVVQQSTGARIYRFSAALNILRTIADMLNVGSISTSDSTSLGHSIVEAIDAPLQLPMGGSIDWLDVVLPPQTELSRLISCAIERALVCHQCIDREVFYTRIDDLYNTATRDSITKNKSFMALVYAALALGERYSAVDPNTMNPPANSSDFPSGFQYLRASRCITHADVDPCDLDHVVARIFQARYLLSISHVSEAHTTLCKGVSVATHMGLHLDDSTLRTRYSSNELDDRRCVFAVLCMMDNYMSFILGLPRALSSAHPRQTLSLRGDDVHDEGQGLLQRDPTSPTAETVMAEMMFHIYAKILDHQSAGDVESWIASDWIADIQHDFKRWEAMLPELPEGPSSSRELLGQLTLRMHYIGAQILLYAPCIHHLARERTDPEFNVDGFTYGSDCVRAAAQAVLLIEILEAQQLLNPALWMHGFILTLAASVLTYFVIYARSRVTIEENKSTIMKAGRLLASLGRTNAANKQVFDSLSPYVDIVLEQHE